MQQTMYWLFGFAIAVLFLVAASRYIALRRYASLVDPDAMRFRDGTVRGIYSGRKIDIGLVPSDLGIPKPAKVQLSIECATPIRIEARPKSLATLFRRAVGIYGDRETGIDALDRRFLIQCDGRTRTETAVARIEAQQSLLTLADLGADLVLLTNGRLTVEMPMTFILPPRAERVRQALSAMHTLASATESALSVPSPDATTAGCIVATPVAVDPVASDLWSASRASGATIASPVSLATFFIAMTIGFLILSSFWDFNGRVPWEARLALVQDRLPVVALLACAGGFLSAFLVSRGPLFWAFQVSWPLVIHAMLVGALYLVLRESGVPEIVQALHVELRAIP